MPTRDERQRRRHEEELALARRLVALHALGTAPPNAHWNLAAFEHRPASVGCTLVAAETAENSTFSIHLAEVSGLNPIAGTLAAQCCLEILRRTEGVDLVELNRYFFDQPPGERAMIAAGSLRFDAGDSTWQGSFAGMVAPILVDAGGGAELLRGSGPFLGLTETTFPILRGRLRPGARLILLAGSGAGEVLTDLLARLSKSTPSPPATQIGRLGSELVADLESGFGLTLVGIERTALPAPGANVE